MQTAEETGIYKCTNDGQTKSFTAGEQMTPCSCGKGTWQLKDSEGKARTKPQKSRFSEWAQKYSP